MATSVFAIAVAELTANDPHIVIGGQFTETAALAIAQASEDIVVQRLEGMGHDADALTGRMYRVARQAALEVAVSKVRYRISMIDSQSHEREMRLALDPIARLETRPQDAGSQQPITDDAPGIFDSEAGRDGTAEPRASFLSRMITSRGR